jgi:ribosomal protein L7/L12
MNWYWAAGLVAVLLLGLASRRGERASGTPRRTPRGRTSVAAGDIDALLQAGQKIEAIKAYRALHGVDLKTAKDAMDARARELGR